ncbi:phosphotransferase [Acetobacter papayae]|uniref:phosphotransferase n=1 Tax=Acetobacter papayae TaxID=1076592 RepID=UPI0039E8B16C
MTHTLHDRLRALPCWTAPVDPRPLGGGITNSNFVVEDGSRRYVVRVGQDIPLHNVMRFNEQAASYAAALAGISPPVRYAEADLLVIDFIEGKTLDAAGVRARLPAVVELVRRMHTGLREHLAGPALSFWIFHVLRNYLRVLRQKGARPITQLERLERITQELEQGLGPTETLFAHNDLLPANFLDDGERLWLIDWDYGGFNAPLFDLGNLASNNAFDPEQRETMLTLYYGHPPDGALRYRLQVMAVASLLREGLWSMVSETESTIDFDYRDYTRMNMSVFEQELQTLISMRG